MLSFNKNKSSDLSNMKKLFKKSVPDKMTMMMKKRRQNWYYKVTECARTHTLTLALPLFPVSANWMEFPPTPQNASMTSWESEKLWSTLRAMCSAIFSGVTENQPSETHISTTMLTSEPVCFYFVLFCLVTFWHEVKEKERSHKAALEITFDSAT